MKVSDAFPSNFLKAEDLDGKTVTVTISEVTLEDLGQGKKKETKLVAAFRGKDKKLVLNKTNSSTIAKLYGDDTDDWIGQRISIMPREVEFQGDMVLAIRVSLQKPASPAARQQEPVQLKKPSQQAEPEPANLEGDSEIPF